ncbi:metal-dependent hydrolase [Elusimicrobiota bacterium]
MLIAHLPAGYLVTKALQRRKAYAAATWIGLLGGVLPDLDMVFFFLDGRRTMHHHYWSHMPLYWAMIAAALYAAARRTSLRREIECVLNLFFANILLHMVLDSITAPMLWLYPFSSRPLELIRIPATHDWWVWSFVFHWSFLLEAGIAGAALWLLLRPRR